MENSTLLFSIGGLLVTPFTLVVNYMSNLSKRINQNTEDIAAHVASDKATLEALHITLEDLKAGQIRGEGKLDQLVYRFIPPAK